MDTYVYSCGRYNGLFCPPFAQKQDAAAMKIPDFRTSEQSLITRTCCAKIDIRMNVYTVAHKSGRTLSAENLYAHIAISIVIKHFAIWSIV